MNAVAMIRRCAQHGVSPRLPTDISPSQYDEVTPRVGDPIDTPVAFATPSDQGIEGAIPLAVEPDSVPDMSMPFVGECFADA